MTRRRTIIAAITISLLCVVVGYLLQTNSNLHTAQSIMAADWNLGFGKRTALADGGSIANGIRYSEGSVVHEFDPEQDNIEGQLQNFIRRIRRDLTDEIIDAQFGDGDLKQVQSRMDVSGHRYLRHGSRGCISVSAHYFEDLNDTDSRHFVRVDYRIYVSFGLLPFWAS